MTSTFHELVRQRGAQMLRAAFSPRESAEDLPVLYFPPGQTTCQPLHQVNIGQITIELIEDDRTGAVERRETCTVRIPRALNGLEAKLQRKAKFILPTYDDRQWAVQQQGGQVGHYWNVYQLERRPLARYDEKVDVPDR